MEFIKTHLWQILISLNYILALSAVVAVLFKRINPAKTLSYIIALLVFPFLGLLVYYFFGQEYRKSKIFSRKNVLNNSIVKKVKQNFESKIKTIQDFDNVLEKKSKLISLLNTSENSKLTLNNSIKIIKNGDEKFNLVFNDLEAAIHHIHIEYFIIKDDKIGSKFINLLCQKVKSGIDVKVVIDDVGSDISKETKKKMKDCGVKLQVFMPVLFSNSTGKMNYRDHRKIIIVDGKIGYVGGINISDNYVNSINNSYFRDTHARLEGDIVKQLQILFLTTWDFVTKKDIKILEHYFPNVNNKGNVPIQIAASGPDTNWTNIKDALFLAITNATDCIYITTPYFIPDDEIVKALQIAARSNIDVKLLVPKTSDSWISEYATNSFLERLLESGIEVYQYNKGFIHAKTVLVDDSFSSIGTANMDYRSFNINFEVNALVYHKETNKTLKTIFFEDLNDANKLQFEDWKNRSKLTKAAEALANLMAPLL